MKRIKVRRADRCAGCGVELAVGAEVWWDAGPKAVWCLACGEAPADEQAGGSARREYERRTERERARQEQLISEDRAWREATIERRPVLGRIATGLTAKPTIGPEKQSTTAWKVGAEGEERVAEVLRDVPGIEVLHDRRVPGSRANIDHLVVGPAGVFVIDAKKYKAGSIVEVRDVGGIFRPDRRLYVAGRNRTKLVEGVRGQFDVVRAALAPELGDVPVRGVLCFVGANWGRRRKTKAIGSVTAVWPTGLPGLVTAKGPHGPDVERIATHLRQNLPPAAR